MAVKQESEVDLSTLLKSGVHGKHEEAHHVMFDFLRGGFDIGAYKAYTSQLYYIYSTLEKELSRFKDHDVVGPVYFPDELSRTESLERDLEYFYGEHWMDKKVPCLEPTQKYVKRIRQVAQTDPELLIVHAHVRYRGDVAGGQILKRLIQKLWSINDDGMNFYNFTHVESIPKFKQFYDGRMNSLELSSQQQTKLVQEAIETFQLNIDVFTELLRIVRAEQTRKENCRVSEKEIEKIVFGARLQKPSMVPTHVTSNISLNSNIATIIAFSSLLIVGSALVLHKYVITSNLQ